MTAALLASLIGGCLIFIAAIVWLLRPRRDPPPDPMEYTEPPPRVFTRIWDGNNNKEN